MHEIGHAVGLWHEQSREDRDRFVRVVWANIQAGREHNFNQHITDGDDIGGYDYGSIMHYPRTAFTRNGQDTIVPVGGQAIGQRNGLSAATSRPCARCIPNSNRRSPGAGHSSRDRARQLHPEPGSRTAGRRIGSSSGPLSRPLLSSTARRSSS